MKKVGSVSTDAESYYRLALDTQHKERPERVLEYFDRAIAAHPDYAMPTSGCCCAASPS